MNDYKASNREKAKTPRGKSFWCGCDMAKVNAGSRCLVCGKREGKPRDKR
jgi:hypothetical protein